MPRVGSFRGGWWRTALFFGVAVAVSASDQLSKGWIRENLAVGQTLPVVGIFQLTHVQNTGSAFGMFQSYTFPLTIMSFIGAVVILVYAFYIRRQYPFLNNGISMAALGGALGGTVGNLIDRFTLGHVTDFILVGTFPTYNVADASITTGTSVFAGSLIYLLVKEKQAREAAIKDDESPET